MKIQAAQRMEAANRHIDFPYSPEAIVKEFSDILQRRNPNWEGDPRYNAGYYLYELRLKDPSKAKRVAEFMESQGDKHEAVSERTMRQGIAILQGKRAEL